MTDVVVTGSGIVSALGDRPEQLHEALCDSRRAFGASAVLGAEAGAYPVAEVPGFDPRSYLGAKNMRPLDRTGQLAAAAAELALADSGWTVELRQQRDIGIVLGTTFCSVRTIGEFDRRAMRDGPEYASPLDFSNTVINAAAGQVAIWHKLRGVNSTISTGAASGLHAIGYAAQLIRAGRAEALLAGGAEELCFEAFLGAERGGLLDSSAPRPYDARRGGYALGEGAGFVVLESAESAAARGARIIGRIHAFSAGYDARGAMGDPDGDNALTLVLDRAVANGGPRPAAVIASGSGSQAIDAREANALAAVAAVRLPTTTLKGHLGEALGANGPFQVVVALESLRRRKLPPIAGLSERDPAFDLDFVTGGARDLDGSAVLITALAREGNCCALLLSGGEA